MVRFFPPVFLVFSYVGYFVLPPDSRNTTTYLRRRAITERGSNRGEDYDHNPLNHQDRTSITSTDPLHTSTEDVVPILFRAQDPETLAAKELKQKNLSKSIVSMSVLVPAAYGGEFFQQFRLLADSINGSTRLPRELVVSVSGLPSELTDESGLTSLEIRARNMVYPPVEVKVLLTERKQNQALNRNAAFRASDPSTKIISLMDL